jgi:small subunit ribosomal protein S16
MVIIKLKRIGRKNLPCYNIIVINKSSYIKGKYIEKIGYFISNNSININIDRVKFWIMNGACLSNRFNNIYKKYKKNNDN